MLADGQELPDGIVLETGVAVVGAGPAGLTVATELADAGIDVCVLEAGPIAEDRAARADAKGENVDTRYYRLEQTRARGIGGTSQRWARPRGVRLHPLQPIDLERREAIPHSGWPFGYEELARYYPRAEGHCGLDDRGYAAETWANEHRPVLTVPENAVATTVFRFAPAARFDHLSRIAARRRMQVFVNTAAAELLTDDVGTRADGVRATTASGQTVTVRARAVVLAGGGIDNARLLLATTRAQPAGLGNGHRLVGRFFMEHPHARTGVVRLSDPLLATRLRLYQVHEIAGARIQAKLHPVADVVRREGLVNSAWFVFPRDPALVSPAARALVDLRELAVYRRPLPATSARLRAVVARPADAIRAVLRTQHAVESGERTCLQLAFMAEQVPNPDSRVTLGRSRDRFGLPVARLDWRLTALDHDAIRRTQDVLDEAFRKAGLGRLEGRLGDDHPPPNLGGGFHHMGTTRMHADPAHGVVDADCRVHGVGNLYIAGSSVFPTGGFANPTLTLVALACRLADHLRKHDELRAGQRALPT